MEDIWDRRVHGTTTEGGQIVRYDRSGKWYVEFATKADGTARKREAVSVTCAAELAAAGTTNPGVPGGQIFDARVRRIQAAPAARER